jgi:hypothetical protein
MTRNERKCLQAVLADLKWRTAKIGGTVNYLEDFLNPGGEAPFDVPPFEKDVLFETGELLAKHSFAVTKFALTRDHSAQ